MPSRIARQQQIAVFGESGSGKTVLLSSFYGAAQEQALTEDKLFDMVADDTSLGRGLHQNYLGMKNAATLPAATRFSATQYSFSLKRRIAKMGTAKKAKPDDLQLIWHDYPGEWFEGDPANETERVRRVDTFKALIGSDVALMLVDAAMLIENAGEEDRYLKQLLTNYRMHLSRLRDDLLPDGKPLVRFPRVWLFALSKADLLPDMDVLAFRDLLIEKAGGEMNALAEQFRSFASEPEAFSFGEDFVLLSSARFEPGRIEVAEQIGLGLILPIAAILPYTRHEQWAKMLRRGSKVAKDLAHFSTPLMAFLATKVRLPGPLGLAAAVILPRFVDVGSVADGKLRQVHDEAVARHDFVSAVLTGFQLDLDRGVQDRVLLRSLK